MPPTLVKVLTMRVYQSRSDQLRLGSTKGNGPRYIAVLPEGFLCSVEDNSVSADLVPGCADWLRLDPVTNVGHLDARVQFRSATDPTACYYVQFPGIVHLDDKIAKILSWSPEAISTEFGDHYNMTTPIFEVSREQDKWMESAAFLAQGRYVVERGDGTEEQRQSVEYEIFRVDPGK